ncbi:hypothetical protein PFNF135_01827 [Plasmodium falciparum NF135/5.C10]|uniref:Erythrocyte membrane protein 1, PfEMP1 n=1 Tax=Plasmodium falciparum NF135/5.C10 TaxID=1036726 RepID=W4ILB1_PLAFA|nr:hypothetical protein PFNF135_01827 [Plasmodium falciparum NF135/5.C10]
MVTLNGGGGGSPQDDDAKNMFDRIGKEVHDQVKNDAEKYKGELEGSLSQASILGETGDTTDTCKLVEDYYNERLKRKRYPCTELSGKYVERFSDKIGGQCTKEKISGSTNTCGACAPYRRVHLCHHNLESIDTTSMTTHKLLLEVCYAAKYEGQSIRDYYTKHKQTNKDSQICTVLARSFADIGDIVRGKDLFLGNDKEKDQRKKLQQHLKEIFGKIYKDVTTNGKNVKTLQARYEGDKKNYFFQLREDWWTANRETVWEALTCDDRLRGNEYFRPTCNGEKRTKGYCRCGDGDKPKAGNGDVNIVPTYFDYVPQFLRWFEEWAEDFCRLRKHKLKDAIDKCREGQDQSGKKLYCDLNRYDCEKTASGKHVFVEKDECHKCSVACSPFVKWLDNQKLEFLKQKEKYTKEITGGSCSKKRSARGTTKYDGYEKKFYEKLKEKKKYEKVGEFLDLLSKETTCTKNSEIEDGGKIDFAKVSGSSASGDGNKTFYRTKYCEACPWCGAEQERNGVGWKAKDDRDCNPVMDYTNYENTKIPILTGDKTKSEIVERYRKFCKNNGKNGAPVAATDTAASGYNSDNATTGYCGGTNSNSSLCEKWTCYYYKKKENNDGKEINFCVQGAWQNSKKDQKVKSYNAFFWDWVHDMLHDSLEWRERINSCINNAKLGQCENKCNSKCDCFQKWVVQKGKEWDEIKVHFGKQDFGQQGGLLGNFGYDFVLKFVLKIDELLQNIKDTHANANDIERIEKMLLQAGFDGAIAGGGPGGGCIKGGVAEKDTTIDKFLQEELKEAQTCLGTHTKDKCDEPKPEGRSKPTDDTQRDPATVDAEGDEEEEEEEEDDDEVEEPEEVQDTTVEESEPPEKKEEVKVCDTVATALTPDNLTKACEQKYSGNNSRLGWKCIPTGNTSNEGAGKRGVDTTTGSVCIPPRRRKLYVGKLKEWVTTAVESTKSLSPQGLSTPALTPSRAPKGDPLLAAFVESAAIETFFLWDRYKKIKDKEKKEERQRQQENGTLLLPLAKEASQEDEVQNKLNDGTIPDDFLRQMFYTLGDYRDICVGNTPSGIDTVSASDSGDNKSSKNPMQEISDKIKEMLKKQSGEQTPGQQSPSGAKTPEEWWEQHAPSIWNAMVCALTYKETSGSGGEKKIEKNNDVYEKFFGTQNAKPGLAPGTFESKYKYTDVKLDENSETQAKPTHASPSSGDNTPKLSDFIKRPPYFRYLEEWGENFCKERKKRLEEVKKECEVGEKGNRGCSGDGLKCDEAVPKNEEIFGDFHCSKCAKPCRKYRKWIERKKYEFTEQYNAYTKQKENCEMETTVAEVNNHGNGFCTKLKTTSSTAASFLQNLGPCKVQNGEDEIKFDKDSETFKHTKHCDPCSEFKIKCQNGNCRSGGDTKGKCNGITTIDAKDIEEMRKYTDDVGMLVSDDSTKKFEGDLKVCEGKGIFKGIRKDEWTCGKVCGVDICSLKKKDTKGQESGKKYIIMKELLKRWLEYFFEDYNRIQKKLKPCIENDEGCKCIKGCVEKWVQEKKEEWDKINATYLKKYTEKNPDGNNLTNFLEKFEHRPEFKNAIKPCGGLTAFEDSSHCNGAPNLENANGQKRDAVDCLLKKLRKEAEKCQNQNKNQASVETQDQHSDDTKTSCNVPPDVEDEEPLEEEGDQNPVGKQQPSFCPKVDTPKPEEGGCEPASPAPPTSHDKVEKPEEKPEADPEPEEEAPEQDASKPKQEKPAEDKKDKPKERRPIQPPYVDHPLLKPALMSSTIMWSIGIGFATFTYFYLKKKTKHPVDLFSVINIPKSDYGMPTKLSSNRYIPYKSAQYRGKRYIYLEGDSGTDSGYTDHYSDITSSSESEYEEMDINDIYVPGSPKYKTLIEVVLEPSKRDTQNDIPMITIPTSDTPPPTSGNTIPTSDIPNTPSDTPSPITDEEWNTLKDDFISNMLQNEQEDILQPDVSKELPLNTHPTPSHDTLDQKPFIMSIHDRNLLNGEEYSYDMINNIGNNDLYSGFDPKSGDNVSYSGTIGSISDKTSPYSGIDLINDSLNSGNHIDIYDEILKRKENELFGTNHVKHISTHSVAKLTNSDPIECQLNLFHKWLDRHRDMCEKFSNNKEELLDKLKEQWENKTHSGNKHSDIPSGKLSDTPSDNNIHSDIHPSDIPSGKQSDIPSDNNIHSDIPYVLNSDVSIQIDMDNPNQVDDNTYLDTYPDKSTMDTIMDDLEKYNEPYYDIYYDVNDHDASNVDSNNMDVPSKVKIEMSVKNTQMMEGKYPIGDVWDI